MSGISANVHMEELKGNIYMQISGDHCLNCVREDCNKRQRQRGVSTGSRESYRKNNHDLKKNKLTGVCAVSMARLTQVSLTLNGTHYSGMSRLTPHIWLNSFENWRNLEL